MDSGDALHHLQTGPFKYAHIGTKARNHADSRPTLRIGVHAIYLTAPLDAKAWTQVQTRLPSRLQPHLMAIVYGYAVEVLTRTERHERQPCHPLHDHLQSLRLVVRRRLARGRLYRQCEASRGPPPTRSQRPAWRWHQ